MRGGVPVVLAFVLAAASLGASTPQRDSALSSLTVPERQLPDGCRVQPFTAPTTPVAVTLGNRGSSFPFPANPWAGSERPLLVELRKSIAGSLLRLPDAPPMTPSEIAAMENTWVADIVEGYRASYADADGTSVVVSAIKFRNRQMAESARPAASPGAQFRSVYVTGPAVVDVRGGSGSSCFSAVDRYVQTFK